MSRPDRCPECGLDGIYLNAEFVRIEPEERMQDGTRNGYVSHEEMYVEFLSCGCGWEDFNSFPTHEITRAVLERELRNRKADQ